jgi:amino acid transporter
MTEKVELSRAMGMVSVSMIGVGAMIGAGIFVLTGIAAGTAGPALLLVFFLNAIIATFTAMTYAELSSAIPEAGGGYVWVKRALPSVYGFISGWMDWFAHAVAGSLYALGFAAYFGMLLEYYGIQVFGLTGEPLSKLLALLIALIFIYINYQGASETGVIANIVGITKLSILGIFIISGLYVMFRRPDALSNFSPFVPHGMGGVFAAMGLTFIAFEGYEVIAQAAEEIKDPKKNLPRAIFLSLAIVIPVYLLVAFVAIGALQTDIPSWMYLGQHKELGLLEAARQFMPFGMSLLLLGGLVSTMSALNATTFSSTRVAFAMGRDYNLPGIFKNIHPEKQTPYTSLFITGALIIAMALALPLEDVASASAVMFLLLFIQVNAACIIIRKKFGSELEYGYKMPLFPLIPVLAIISQLFLALYMFKYSPAGWFSIIIWIALGFLIYFGYSVEKEKVEKGKVKRQISPGDYRVVVSLSNIKNVEPLITLGAAIARAQKSELVALYVIAVPRQTFLETGHQFIKDSEPLFEKAVSTGKKFRVPIIKKIVASHEVPEAILDLTRKGKSNIVLLGGTERVFRGKLKQSISDIVIRNADCDVGVFFNRDSMKLKKILVPVGLGGNENRIRIGEKLAGFFSAEMTIFTAVKDRESKERMERKHKDIMGKLERKTHSKIEIAGSLEKAILKKTKDFDMVIIGPSREWLLKDFLFGSLPDKIIKKSDCSVLILKEPELRTESWAELAFDKLRRI